MNANADGWVGNVSYDWGVLGGSSTVTATPTKDTMIVVTATVKSTTGSCEKKDSIFIKVNDAPVVEKIDVDATSICQGQQVTINATSIKNAVYTWYEDGVKIPGENLETITRTPNAGKHIYAVNMCRKICEQQGYVSAYGEGNNSINKVGIVSDDKGNMKFFAELEKTSDKQKERIEKAREKKAEEKKASERRANKKNPYEKDSKPSVKRTTIEADSYNELLDKLENMDWSKISDSKSGDRFNFSV